jgi:hypothetical protein
MSTAVFGNRFRMVKGHLATIKKPKAGPLTWQMSVIWGQRLWKVHPAQAYFFHDRQGPLLPLGRVHVGVDFQRFFHYGPHLFRRWSEP